jgi:hypothetical protein
MDLGNLHSTSFVSPISEHFDQECWHVRSQFGSGNYRPCLRCGLLCESFTTFKCIHCQEFRIFSNDHYLLNGKWTVYPNGLEGYNDDHIYECATCNQITINPEIKYTEKWIKPSKKPDNIEKK